MAYQIFSAENDNKLYLIPIMRTGRTYDEMGICYVAYGTKGYLKTTKGEIRECKCVGTRWQRISGQGIVQFTQWRVAGYSQPIYSMGDCPERVDGGIIYQTEQDAQVGSAYRGGDGHIDYNEETKVCQYLMREYGVSYGNFTYYNWNHSLAVTLYYVTKDHSVAHSQYNKIEMFVDENGLNIVMPKKYSYFPNEQLALAALKPIKVFTFDDEEEETKTNQPAKVKITIEIDCNKINSIKGIAKILDSE